MAIRTKFCWALLPLTLLFPGCATTNLPPVTAHTVVITLTGSPGCAFKGGYQIHDKEIAVNGVVPWTSPKAPIRSFHFEKLTPNGVLTLQAQYDDSSGAHASQSSTLKDDTQRVRGSVLEHGMRTQTD